MLLHGFEQCRLCLGRRAIDFVGEDHVREDRSFDELHATTAVARFFEDLRSGDVSGHQVRRELNTLKLEMEDLCDGPHEQRLGKPRRAGQQTVPARKEADEQLLDRFLLADDRFGKFAIDAIAAFAQLLDDLLFGFVGI